MSSRVPWTHWVHAVQLGVAVCLLAGLAAGRDAAGHAVPIALTPAAGAALPETPPEVVLRFSERVESRASTLTVVDAQGRRVDRDDAAVDPADPWRYRVGLTPLAAGAYTVSWRVLSADDGHVTGGAHVFVVGAASAPPAPAAGGGGTAALRPLARWLVTAGGADLLGGLGRLGGVAVLVGGTLDLALQAAALAGARPLPAVLAALLATPSGHVWLARAGLLALLAILAWRPVGRWRAAATAALAGGVVLSGGAVSHAAAVPDRWLALGAEACHLLAAALWVGGLIGFTRLWRRTGPAASPSLRALALAVPDFSVRAIPAVGLLAASGLVLARLHVPAWGDLVATPYGRWLLAKLGVFAGMLVLGAYHQGVVHPRLCRAAARGAEDPRTVAWFRRSLRLEAGLGLSALLLAAGLAVTPPPAPPGFRHARAVGPVHVQLQITPGRPGLNVVRLAVTDHAGGPLRDATAALVQVTPAAGGLGPVTVTLPRTGPGTFEAPDALLGPVGRWDGRLVVQREGAYDVNDRFELTLSTPGRAALDAPTTWSLAGIALVTLGLAARARRTRHTTHHLEGGIPC